ncbi:MAG: PRD domain-containing protein [Brevinema sp.]
MEQLITRLTILRDSHTISPEVFEKSLLFTQRLNHKQLLNSSDTLTMMITHITMALQRVLSKESIIEMDKTIKEEIKNHPKIQRATLLWEENQDLFKILPENEKYYILANFCNIL